jgi:hypothetical protein
LTRAKKFLWFVGNLQSIAPISINFKNLAKYVLSQEKTYQAFGQNDDWKN